MYLFHVSFGDYLNIVDNFGGYRDESIGAPHPQFYYESEESFYFYFPVGSMIYFTIIHKIHLEDLGYKDESHFQIQHLRDKFELLEPVQSNVKITTA